MWKTSSWCKTSIDIANISIPDLSDLLKKTGDNYYPVIM